jgi:hypothetical protein
MRGGALPPALLSLSLAMALAFAPRRVWWPCIALFVAIALLVAALPLPRSWVEAVFIGCWVSILACACAVHVTGGVSCLGGLLLSLNVGAWSGAVITLAGVMSDFGLALPCACGVFPAAWIAHRGHPIVVKVIASWLMAIALLSAALQFIPVTPGYLPDHLQ